MWPDPMQPMLNPLEEHYRLVPGAFAFDRCRVQSEAAERLSLDPELSGVDQRPLSIAFQRNRFSLSFELSEVVAHLRHERYRWPSSSGSLLHRWSRWAYYGLRPWLPVPVRRHAQRRALRGWQHRSFPHWPVDRTVDRLFEAFLCTALRSGEVHAIPFIWFWPEGRSGCVVMTHDVETQKGLEGCARLMAMDAAHGISSSFQLIPGGRYRVPASLREGMRGRGFEVNVHDWNHDGRLFSRRSTFARRAPQIRRSLEQWHCAGFRSGALYRDLDWLQELGAAYDMSVPNVAHLDPQPGGCCTTFPWRVGAMLEIPVTTTQDYSLFHILGDYSLGLWQQQLAIILEGHGMASFIVHPDYLQEKRAWQTYAALLSCLEGLRHDRAVWIASPGEVHRWWRQRLQMSLVPEGDGWRIAGPGQERAQVAWARLRDGKLRYTLSEPAVA